MILCPKCKGELSFEVLPDYSNDDESIEIRGTCDDCNEVFFTFIESTILVPLEEE